MLSFFFKSQRNKYRHVKQLKDFLFFIFNAQKNKIRPVTAVDCAGCVHTLHVNYAANKTSQSLQRIQSISAPVFRRPFKCIAQHFPSEKARQQFERKAVRHARAALLNTATLFCAALATFGALLPFARVLYICLLVNRRRDASREVLLFHSAL